MQPTPSRLSAEVEYFTERAQAVLDNEADIAAERREAAAARVTFDDVLEQLANLPAKTKAEMMQYIDSDRRMFEWKLYAMFIDGLEKATNAYLKGN